MQDAQVGKIDLSVGEIGVKCDGLTPTTGRVRFTDAAARSLVASLFAPALKRFRLLLFRLGLRETADR